MSAKYMSEKVQYEYSFAVTRATVAMPHWPNQLILAEAQHTCGSTSTLGQFSCQYKC